MFGSVTSKLIAGGILALVLVLGGWYVVHIIQRNAELEIEAAQAKAEAEQLRTDLANNKKAVAELVDRYGEVYREYKTAKEAVRGRNTKKILNAQPTQTAEQINKEINGLFTGMEMKTE